MNLSFRGNPIDNGAYSVYGSCECGGTYLQTNTFVKRTTIPETLFDENYGGCVCKCDKCNHLVFFPNQHDFCYKTWKEIEESWYDQEIKDQKYYDEWNRVHNDI